MQSTDQSPCSKTQFTRPQSKKKTNPIPRAEGEEMSNPTSASARVTNKATPCCRKVGLKRGPWTPEEDQLLASYIAREGEGRWRTLPSRAGLLRCCKSCRLRWMNYLRPTVKRGQIAPDEEDLILRLHRLLGNRWSLIAGRIPGRTDNEIKNYWNTHLSKKLISQGLDPRTHKPLNPNPSCDARATAPAPAPNPNPNSSSSEEKGDGVGDPHDPNIIDSNCGAGYNFQGPNQMDGVADNNLQKADGMMMMPMGSQDLTGNRNDAEDVDCSADDVFSSFLDSLIDEDMFLKEQLLSMGASSYSLGPSMLGFDANLGAAIPSQEGGDGDECPQLVDHVGKCL